MKQKKKISASGIGRKHMINAKIAISKKNRKLSDEQILVILSDNRIYKEIAKDYNVSSMTIFRVKNGIIKPFIEYTMDINENNNS